MSDEERLLKEVLDLAEMLASAEAVAGKALEQLSTVRRHHRARVAEYKKACVLSDPTGDLGSPAGKLEAAIGLGVDDADDTPDAATEKHDAVAEVLARAEANRENRVKIPPLQGDRPGRGARLSGGAADDTIEPREDGAKRPPTDTPSRPESSPRSDQDGRSGE